MGIHDPYLAALAAEQQQARGQAGLMGQQLGTLGGYISDPRYLHEARIQEVRRWLEYMETTQPHNLYREFRKTIEGWDLVSMGIPRLQSIFEKIKQKYVEPVPVPASPRKQTWFDEIQVEVNEWLKEFK